MSEACCGKVNSAHIDAETRRTLWIVLIANASMFVVETIGGHAVGSLALQADALDFAADAATYGVTLWAIGRAAHVRTRAALIKSAAMLAMGAFIFAMAVVRLLSPAPPEAAPMGLIGALALAVNLGAVIMLLRFRKSDANLRSVWLCSRNDAFGNILVILAAGATAATRSPWPDFSVGVIMCLLFVSGSWAVYRQARRESAAAIQR
ncbi:MAG: cation transporter [Hyphomonadaceae bacterium]|jgi:cation diffusion facilitator family transporter|nr:cation transporter [Caulobacterales bacterium]MBX3431493.1 cation transporter [Hyphomonadaceae bacterium]